MVQYDLIQSNSLQHNINKQSISLEYRNNTNTILKNADLICNQPYKMSKAHKHTMHY